ncbi:MAG: ABC transporter ATP-binding protein [Phycisphaeraceae bacterium]
MPTFLRLLRYLRPYWARLLLAGSCLVLSMPAQLFHPLVWMFVVDEALLADEPMFATLVGGSDTQHRLMLIAAAVGVMFAVQLLGTALGGARTYFLGQVGQRFILDLRHDLFGRLLGHALPFFHRHRTGDLIARSMGDVDTLEQVALRGTDEIVTNALQLIGVATIIVWLNWKVGLLTLAPMVGVALMVHMFNARVRGLYRRVRDRLGDVSDKLQESISGIFVIKSFARERHESEQFAARNEEYYDTAMRAVVARSLYFPAVRTVGFLSNIAMIGGGAYFYLYGTFTIGNFVAYRGYWWQLFSPVNSLARINEMIQRAIAAASRVFDLMDEPVQIRDRTDAVALERGAGHIRFENVSFNYAERDGTLRDVTFEAASGQHLGVVGPSGAGKSTILALLLRLYDVSDGAVRFDGRDVRELTQRSLREQFGLVTQEPFLFNDTIRANMLYGRPDASESDMIEAARQANVHEFIDGLPHGYDTIVGERGVRLSGGQKQRICIARAFLADPTVLLLDEPTASVEAESESIIQAAIQHVLVGRTAVIVSHRLSMVRDCDQIIVVDDGRITERGTHDELMAANGWYARMYRLQAGEGDS